MMALRWSPARTRSRAEYTAQAQLESLGIDVFMPCVLTPRARPGRDDAPLFPGYLFVHLDRDEDRTHLLRSLPQYLGLVAFGGTAPPVADDVIDGIAERVDAINSGGGLEVRPAHGDRVVLTVGRTELSAQVVDRDASPRSRIRVLLEFLGRQVPAELSPGSAALMGLRPRERMLASRVPRRTRGRRRWIQGFGDREPVPAV